MVLNAHRHNLERYIYLRDITQTCRHKPERHQVEQEKIYCRNQKDTSWKVIKWKQTQGIEQDISQKETSQKDISQTGTQSIERYKLERDTVISVTERLVGVICLSIHIPHDKGIIGTFLKIISVIIVWFPSQPDSFQSVSHSWLCHVLFIFLRSSLQYAFPACVFEAFVFLSYVFVYLVSF